MIIDLSRHVSLQNINVHIDENALHEILNEVDLNKNGQVEIDEFLQVGDQSPVGEVKFVLQGCRHSVLVAEGNVNLYSFKAVG